MDSLTKFLQAKRDMDTAANHARNLQTSLEDLEHRAKKIHRADKSGKPVYDRCFGEDVGAARKMARALVQTAGGVQAKVRIALRNAGSKVPETELRLVDAAGRKLKKSVQEAAESAHAVCQYALSPSDKSTATYIIADLEKLHVGGVGGDKAEEPRSFDQG